MATLSFIEFTSLTWLFLVVMQEQKWLIGIILMVPIYTLTSVIILTLSDCTCIRAGIVMRFYESLV